jgi:hypothetical protein
VSRRATRFELPPTLCRSCASSQARRCRRNFVGRTGLIQSIVQGLAAIGAARTGASRQRGWAPPPAKPHQRGRWSSGLANRPPVVYTRCGSSTSLMPSSSPELISGRADIKHAEQDGRCRPRACESVSEARVSWPWRLMPKRRGPRAAPAIVADRAISTIGRRIGRGAGVPTAVLSVSRTG